MKKIQYLTLLISVSIASCSSNFFYSNPIGKYEENIERIYVLFDIKEGYDFAMGGMVDQFSESFNDLGIPVSVQIHTEGKKREKSYLEVAKELNVSLILKVKQTYASGKLSKVPPLAYAYPTYASPNSGTRNESSFEFTLSTLSSRTIWRGNGSTSFGAIHDPDGGRPLANKVLSALKKDGVI